MKAIQEVFSSFKVVGQEHCDKHDQMFDLIETPAGVSGQCKVCFQEKKKQEDALMVQETIQNQKEGFNNFVMNFERVTSDLKAATVNSYHPKHETQLRAKQAVISFVKEFSKSDPNKSLVISGTPGLGKSHLGYATAKAIRSKGLSALYIKSTELLDHIKNTYKDNTMVTEERIYQMIEKLDLLVLDDLGSEYIKMNESGHESWASDVLYKTLDLRLNQPLICTTNYSERDLELKYGFNGPRIVSRMMDNAQAIRLQGEDHRRKNRF